jgi:hypothetical protein
MNTVCLTEVSTGGMEGSQKREIPPSMEEFKKYLQRQSLLYLKQLTELLSTHYKHYVKPSPAFICLLDY